jgi:hypothetical protein
VAAPAGDAAASTGRWATPVGGVSSIIGALSSEWIGAEAADAFDIDGSASLVGVTTVFVSSAGEGLMVGGAASGCTSATMVRRGTSVSRAADTVAGAGAASGAVGRRTSRWELVETPLWGNAIRACDRELIPCTADAPDCEGCLTVAVIVGASLPNTRFASPEAPESHLVGASSANCCKNALCDATAVFDHPGSALRGAPTSVNP